MLVVDPCHDGETARYVKVWGGEVDVAKWGGGWGDGEGGKGDRWEKEIVWAEWMQEVKLGRLSQTDCDGKIERNEMEKALGGAII